MTTCSQKPIGVFDSGMGGLTALKELAGLLPNENLLYLGDTARVPYGNRSIETIISYAKEGIAFLLKHSVKQILVACNTASAVAMPIIEALSPVPVMGVIQPAADAVIQKNYTRIGVIGTRTTIQSCSYETAIKKQKGASVSVYSKACPLFVPLIEEGWESHPVAELIAKEYLETMREVSIEALILGCTHYPFLKKMISNILPHTHLIDSGAEAALLVAEQIKHAVVLPNTTKKKARCIQCYVTDLSPAFKQLAPRFLGLPLKTFYQVSLNAL